MTSPIVRFAPSPTGRLHVGNVRTALINYLFAKGQNGKFLLRIDDTDLERSTKDYEDGLKTDLNWLGITWDDTFNQSDRFGNYDAAVEKLKSAGLLYACYETPEELERKRKIALSRGRPPVYDRSGLSLSDTEIKAFEAEGRTPHWRFKLSGDRVEWNDLVRGPQSIDTSSVSDPILVRGDGSYLYTLPSVVDDIEYGITHVVRGEDHVTNSGAQIEIFRALGGTSPDMAHTPLLIGADGQGLSKRLGSLSMMELSKKGIEPMAIASLLAKIGTSDNVELKPSLEVLCEEFSFDKIGRAPARFDEADLYKLNAAILQEMEPSLAVAKLAELEGFHTIGAPELFWDTIKGNISTISEANDWIEVVTGKIQDTDLSEDQDYLRAALEHLPSGAFDLETWSSWTGELKAATGRKGRGLFMPLRKALTGLERGPEMNRMIVLLGEETCRARLEKAIV
ncbi:MAG: glutamate--tRNA ligase [Ponticaulis sp.]|nr:glutamate--tRNA ligase [Ponticaulis sp.]